MSWITALPINLRRRSSLFDLSFFRFCPRPPRPPRGAITLSSPDLLGERDAARALRLWARQPEINGMQVFLTRGGVIRG